LKRYSWRSARHRLDQEFHGVIWGADHAGAEEEPFDVIASVKADGQLRHLRRGQQHPLDIVRAAVDAVGAVIDAAVGHQDLEEGNAAAVAGPAMADTAGGGIADAVPVAAETAAGGTGDVVFRAFGKDFQSVHHVGCHGCCSPPHRVREMNIRRQ